MFASADGQLNTVDPYLYWPEQPKLHLFPPMLARFEGRLLHSRLGRYPRLGDIPA